MLIEHPTPALSPTLLPEQLVMMRLTTETQGEVLSFLAERPLHNVVMTGLIRDHGIESKLNRGIFFGCRNESDALLGVALIGHAVFLDARTEDATRRFAQLAQQFPPAHMLMGEKDSIERFWNYYAANSRPKHRLCREVLFEMTQRLPQSWAVPGLRAADVSDLERVLPVHAAMACEESSVNPLQVDPEGFRRRCRQRIEEGRTFVLVEQSQLIFKADIVSDTPDVIYIEGVHVHPEFRGHGYGSRCMAQLTGELLQRTRSISLLVNEERRQAQEFFKSLGFIGRGLYHTIFLRTQTEAVQGTGTKDLGTPH
jgi:predicted GNAT family acetyltransferase